MAPPCKVVIPKVVSDRSVHTDTISNSVVVTGDGSHVTATFGDTGARLDMWRRQVRAPDRRRPPRPGGPPRELELFRLDFDVLPFQGRQFFDRPAGMAGDCRKFGDPGVEPTLGRGEPQEFSHSQGWTRPSEPVRQLAAVPSKCDADLFAAVRSVVGTAARRNSMRIGDLLRPGRGIRRSTRFGKYNHGGRSYVEWDRVGGTPQGLFHCRRSGWRRPFRAPHVAE